MKNLEHTVDGICERAFEVRAPKRLCHYTKSADNVVEILRSGVLWATDCKAAEGGQHDLDVATPIIFGTLEELGHKHPTGWARVIDRVRADFDRKLKVSAWGTIYVACLTPHPDNPAMWNSTFGGHGLGASIMFRMRPERLPWKDRSVGLYRVEYDQQRFRKDLKSLMDKVMMSAMPRGLSPSVTHQVVLGLSILATKASMRLKDVGWAFQQEWRIVILPELGATLPIQGSRDKPYLHLPLRSQPGELADVERIVLGPLVPLTKVEEIRAQLRALEYGTARGAMPEVELSSRH